MTIDPLSENYSFQSPYAYAVNNPIKFQDVNGMGPGIWDMIKGLFDLFGVHFSIGGNRDKSAEDAKTHADRRKAIKKVGDDVKKLYDAQQKAFSIIPGGELINIAGDLKTGNNTDEGNIATNVAAGIVTSVIPGNLDNAAFHRLRHIFGKAEHALGNLVAKFGSEEKAFNAVQNAANEALKAGKLTPSAGGILPSGDLGNIINVDGIDVRLIGGRIDNDKVVISSFSRKGL
jgi:hypothetical protein